MHLGVSDDITPESHRKASNVAAGVSELLERIHKNGSMRDDAPLGFVAALMSAMADTTVDFMIKDPTDADKYCMNGFDAFWRMTT